MFVITLGSSLFTILPMAIFPRGVGIAGGWTIFFALCAAQAAWAYLVSCAAVTIYEKIAKKGKKTNAGKTSPDTKN